MFRCVDGLNAKGWEPVRSPYPESEIDLASITDLSPADWIGFDRGARNAVQVAVSVKQMAKRMFADFDNLNFFFSFTSRLGCEEISFGNAPQSRR